MYGVGVVAPPMTSAWMGPRRHAPRAFARRGGDELWGGWRRDWKIELIEKNNPTWRDLYPYALRLDGFEP